MLSLFGFGTHQFDWTLMNACQNQTLETSEMSHVVFISLKTCHESKSKGHIFKTFTRVVLAERSNRAPRAIKYMNPEEGESIINEICCAMFEYILSPRV